MSSHREQVIVALEALLKAALPDADVERDAPWPARSRPGGLVIVRDGDPGQPEQAFSPSTFTYQHPIPIEFFGPDGAEERHALLDAMLIKAGEAIVADRSLGGLCNWLEATAPAPEDIVSSGSQPVRAAVVNVVAEYTTSNPLA